MERYQSQGTYQRRTARPSRQVRTRAPRATPLTAAPAEPEVAASAFPPVSDQQRQAGEALLVAAAAFWLWLALGMPGAPKPG